MADSIEDFFTDEDLTNSNLRQHAELTHLFLNGNTDASNTAQALMASADDPSSAVKIYHILEDLIITPAEQLSETHDGLVDLLKCLRELQKQKGNEALLSFDESLSFSLSERWLRYGDPKPDYEWYRDQARLEWTNLNRFAALLYASYGLEMLSAYGEQTLSMTLRRSAWYILWEISQSESRIILAGST